MLKADFFILKLTPVLFWDNANSGVRRKGLGWKKKIGAKNGLQSDLFYVHLSRYF